MIVNLNAPLLDVDGNPVPGATLARSCSIALFSQRHESGEDKLKAYELAKVIRDGADGVDLPIEDWVFVKTKIGELLTPLEYGQICEVIGR